MVRFLSSRFLKKSLRDQAGLTLIEVLIALVIVGISMTAISKAISENIRATAYLQNKTMSMWVGQYILNQTRAGVLKISENDKLTDSIEQLDRTWYWRAYQEVTPNLHIKKITVKVFEKEEDAEPMTTLESYVYRAE